MSAPMKTIGGRQYAFGTLSATQAVKVEVAIARVIGEPLFKALVEAKAPDAKGGAGDAKAAEKIGSVAMGLLAARMNADELIETMTIVFSSVGSEKVKSINMDEEFTGRPRDLWLVFWEALKVNFRGFLPEDLSGSLAGLLPVK